MINTLHEQKEQTFSFLLEPNAQYKASFEKTDQRLNIYQYLELINVHGDLNALWQSKRFESSRIGKG